ncbi:MAG: hypothetical protein LH702_09885, partial [Phormidesmis sp. CAN_BIN44]|nr:hypothetical protein [Phormidesmis sp. CAN_BIN44]
VYTQVLVTSFGSASAPQIPILGNFEPEQWLNFEPLSVSKSPNFGGFRGRKILAMTDQPTCVYTVAMNREIAA